MSKAWNGPMLGIALEGRVLCACVVRRHGRRLEAGKSLRTELTLDPLSASPELAGQEIRNRLDEAGLRAHNCMIAVPASWTFPLQVVLPDVGEDDQRSFIELQAERELPFAVEDLVLSVGRWGGANAKNATVLAIPRTRVDALERVVRAAKLRPVGITTGVTSMLGSADAGRRLALLLGERGAELFAWVDGVAALRTVYESGDEDQEAAFDTEAIARHIRITLGQLPAAARAGMKELLVVGGAHEASEMAEELNPAVSRLGLTIRHVEPPAVAPVTLQHSAAGVALAASVAARALTGQGTVYEFLPPREQQWKTVLRRFSARGMVWGASLALLIVGVGGLTLGYQHYRLASLTSQWKEIEPDVKRIEGLQEQIRRYRPWFDDSAPSLTILNGLTQAFPPDGSVWARMVQIKDQTKVTCTGSSKSDTKWREMANMLQESSGVRELHMDVQGQSPQQFTLTYVWKGERANGE
ncbi:MAG: hypothetical protein ABFD69_12505 [Candidatus Sumerlaeia bacterium]